MPSGKLFIALNWSNNIHCMLWTGCWANRTPFDANAFHYKQIRPTAPSTIVKILRSTLPLLPPSRVERLQINPPRSIAYNRIHRAKSKALSMSIATTTTLPNIIPASQSNRIDRSIDGTQRQISHARNQSRRSIHFRRQCLDVRRPPIPIRFLAIEAISVVWRPTM